MRLEDTIPIGLVVRDRRCVCVGGCEEVAWKVERLLAAGAKIEVFAKREELCERLAGRVREGAVRLVDPADGGADVEGAAVVFVSPMHEGLGHELFERAKEHGTLVCTLDRPAASTFVNPASTDVSGLRITVASGGAAPALVKRIREDLEALLGDPRMASFVRRLTEMRAKLAPGARGAAMRDKVVGFRLVGKLVFPSWADEA
ncbi:MAG: bifunctional precorrin-2 dehydrogenase/sirohydrochlorin ferrochelatase [Polyangiaceae bacterium]|nr:bifunctional precorrin-2 dehydrogenase/sirohydrochlorin ferrochelatase [Polyangiaceae bacterium]